MPTTTIYPDRTQIDLDLGHQSYPIYVGEGILGRLPQWIRESGRLTSRKHCALVSDAAVNSLYGEQVAVCLEDDGFEVARIVVPNGEASKSIGQAERICREMLRAGLDRSAFVVALGGGVVGDLAGFAAAIFQRGIPFVQVPTTVVAQVDSSVGGKTGVNTPEGKNLIGCFHQPCLVLADTRTLQTLADREYQQGFAEVIKHALIRDANMLATISAQGLSRDHLVALISRNIEIKAEIVEQDERETSGTRALLNFGHTIGHGIEAAAGYGGLFHGEAISLGMIAAARLSVKFSTFSEPAVDSLVEMLQKFHLPVTLPEDIDRLAVIEAMKHDKKFEGGAVRLVLLKEPGKAELRKGISFDQLEAAIDELTAT